MLIIKAEKKRIEYVIKEYRKKVESTRLQKQLRENRYYEKPSAKRRRVKDNAKRRNNYGK